MKRISNEQREAIVRRAVADRDSILSKLPPLPSSDDKPSFSGDDMAKFGRDCFRLGALAERERATKLARDWPSPIDGRIPLEIAAAIRKEPT